MSNEIILDEVLGYFNPSTFTIKTSYQPDLTKWPKMSLNLTEEGIRSYSNFIHEVTHYLQFAGTVFGLKYQLAQEQVTSLLAMLLKRNISEGQYGLPFIDDQPPDFWSLAEQKSAIQARFLVERCNHLISGSLQRRQWRKGMKFASLQNISTEAIDSYPLVGLTAMENWATWNQKLFIFGKPIVDRIRSVLHKEYSFKRNTDYTVINDVLNAHGRGSLAALVYWIAFNPPLLSDNEDWDWLCVRVEHLVEAAMNMPKDEEFRPMIETENGLIKYLEMQDELETKLCEATGYDRPLDCITDAIGIVVDQLGSGFCKRPAITITLDVLRWVASHDSVWPLLLWPIASSLLDEDLSQTALRGFPIWLIEYEGQPKNRRHGHNVNCYPTEFFGSFDQMRLSRRLLPAMAWNEPEQNLPCPVPRLRACPQDKAWCSAIFQDTQPDDIDRNSCFLGKSFEKLYGVPVDKMRWLLKD